MLMLFAAADADAIDAASPALPVLPLFATIYGAAIAAY